MSAREDRQVNQRVRTSEVDAVLAACRSLIAISVGSLNAIEDDVTAEQLRVLVVVSRRSVSSLGEVAAGTRMHVSKASRACDRMVELGLLDRRDDPADRRSLQLRLTESGERILRAVTDARRAAILPALRRMDAERRADLIAGLTAFAEANVEPEEADLSALGWAT